jgi:hypothetical protein
MCLQPQKTQPICLHQQACNQAMHLRPILVYHDKLVEILNSKTTSSQTSEHTYNQEDLLNLNL